MARLQDPGTGVGPRRFEARVASIRRNVLSEGPVWVPWTSTILWIDVEVGAVFEGRIEGGLVEESWKLDFEGRVGAAVPAVDGSLLVATANRLVVVHSSGSRLDGPVIIPPGVDSRTNDGACDPAGRFLVGTMPLDDRTAQDHLYRIEDDGSLTAIDSDLSLSNGLGWSPDGQLLYSTDTIPGTIWVRDYDAATGVIGVRREHLHIEDGSPDGLCVDASGNLWVAIWGRGEVRSFSPTGELLATVSVPCPHPSSVAFVGDNLDLLLITTASRDLSEAQLRQYPDAGRLFLADVQATGTPTFAWSASWRDHLGENS